MGLAQLWRSFAQSVADDVRSFDWDSPRTLRAIVTGAATALAVIAAVACNLDYPMWSGLSAFTVTQATARATLLKGLLRTAGTLAAALVATFLLGYIAGNNILLLGALFIAVSYPLYRSFRSAYPYAWLLASITLGIILTAAMNDPTIGLHFAAYRAAEICLGTIVACWMSYLLLPAASDPEHDLALTAAHKVPKRVARRTAIEAGVGIVVVVTLYDWFDLPGFSAAAVSMTRISDPNPELGRQRGFLRLVGCAVGGTLALALVAAGIESLFAMAIVLLVACGIFGYFFYGSPASAYAGMQAGFAFVIAFAPQDQPTTTFDPAIERLAGIVLALIVFWLVDALIGAPTAERPTAEKTAAQKP